MLTRACIKSNLSVLAVAVVFAGAGANASDDSAPAGCHWQAIPALKAHLAVPDGWQFRDVSTKAELAYEVRPAGPGFENAKARYRLRVRRGVDKAEVVAKARAFVESGRAGAVESQAIEEQQHGVLTLFSSFASFAPKQPGIEPSSAALSAAANTRTGTLYTVRFDIPASELDRVAPLGNHLFQKMRLDDEI